MRIGLIAEGPTDFAVIENILVSFIDLDGSDEVFQLQPTLDATTFGQTSGGGWTNVINYLASESFADAIINFDRIIIQMDTDISELDPINVRHDDAIGNKKEVIPLSIEVEQKLVSLIGEDNKAVYQQHINDCIWCLCVSSIECWIYHLIIPGKSLPTRNLVNCEGKIANKKVQLEKKYAAYQKITSRLTKKAGIELLRSKDLSFNRFIESLETSLARGLE